ncbi:GtrA family protein [Paraburkholderia sp. 40]|uniref:GtrA family protein n=1 Tax=Paraburkholderia sp. 40 TaxID=2991059 RepID=UPI003D251B70
MIVLYTLFAAISIGANLGAQKLYLLGAPPFYIVPLSVFVGTAIGLAVKFILDKIWIFKYEHRDLAHGLRSFILYSVMGIGTTVVFWSTEFGAGLLFGTEAARLTGGAIGLVLGYAVKYQLDKQFTFA